MKRIVKFRSDGDKLNIIVDVFEKGTNYWLVRTNSGNWYTEFVEQKFISIETNGLKKEELKHLNTKEDIKNTLDKKIDYAIKNFAENYEGTKDHNFLRKLEEMDISEKSKSHAATRINSFCNEIKPGDYIIIPSHSSKTFAIGVVRSEAYESNQNVSEIQTLKLSIDGESKPTYDTLIRDVEWVSFKSRTQIPLKLLNSFLTVHHSIISLNEYKFYFQGLINPIFIDENNKVNMKVEIKKEDGLDIKDWISLYNQLGEIEKLSESKFKEVKSDVQSPGYIAPVMETVNNITSASPHVLAIYLTYKYFSNNPQLVEKIVLRVLPENRAKAELDKAKHELELSKVNYEKQTFDKKVQENLKSDIKVIIENDDESNIKSDN